jgi:hypothetical protein
VLPVGGRQVELRAAGCRALERIEDGNHPIVVMLRHGIELVVVAASTAKRQAEKDLAGGGDQVVELIEAVLLGVGRLIVPGSQAEEAAGDERLGAGIGKLIAGQLLEHETIERFVLVEGANHVVAITPDVRLDGVALVAIGFGVTHQVEPVPAPALAVGGPGEKIIDNAVEGLRCRGLQEGLLFGERRRQPGKVEVDTAKQGMRRAGGRRLPSPGFEPGEHEPIDGVAGPGRVLDVGDPRPLYGLIGPVLPVRRLDAGVVTCQVAGVVVGRLLGPGRGHKSQDDGGNDQQPIHEATPAKLANRWAIT